MSAGGAVEVVPGVYRLGSEWVNWYLVEEGGRFTAVDAALPGYAKTLESDLDSIGAAVGDIEALVLTHADSDHTGLANRLSEEGARVLVHREADPVLRRPRPKGGDASPVKVVPQLWRPGLIRLLAHFARNGAAKPPAFEGAETYEAGTVLDVPGAPRPVATPGHARGHCAILFEGRRALFAGDALCTLDVVTGERGPRLMPRVLNEDNEQCRESLRALEPLAAEVVLPGHGEPFLGDPAEAVAQALAEPARR